MVVAVLSLTVACSEETEYQETAVPNEISFDVNPTTTRAVVYGSESEFAKESFGIYSWNNSKNTYKVNTAFTKGSTDYTVGKVISEADYKAIGDDDTLKVDVIPAESYKNAKVAKRKGKWFPAASKIWYPDTTLTFLAVYPQPTSPLGTEGLTSLTASYKPGNLAFSYKVPTTATAQKDLMFAYYKGKGTNGTAPLWFTHALTCVKFKIGEFEGVSGINSITMKDVYESGSCTVRPVVDGGKSYYSYETTTAGESKWSPTGSATVTATGAITDLTEGNSLGKDYTFALIPQDLSSKNVTLEMNITYDLTKSITLKATLNSGTWRAGYVNEYTLSFKNDDSKTFKVSVVQSAITGWDPVTPTDASLYNW